MTQYEALEELAAKEGIFLDYTLIKCSDSIDGLYLDFYTKGPKVILINRHIPQCCQLAALAEELGHHFASHGNIVSLKDVTQRKQEVYGRAWAYQRLLPPTEVFSACIDGEGAIWDMADRFGLPESFVREALIFYERKFGGAEMAPIHIHACRTSA